jgi:hypothetical protein
MGEIMLLDFLGLVVLVAWIRAWQRKHGKFTEIKFGLILTSYWSFFTITTFAPLFAINVQVATVLEIVMLCLWWALGYPWIRWLYRMFTMPK